MRLKKLLNIVPFGKPVFFLPPGTVICGPFQSSCAGTIAGQCKGDVNVNSSLVIGRTAEIRGDVYSEKLEVYGRVEGNVFCTEKAIVYNTAVIKGNITAAVIEVKEGARIDGVIKKKNEHGTHGPADDVNAGIANVGTENIEGIEEQPTDAIPEPVVVKEPEPERSGDEDRRDSANWF